MLTLADGALCSGDTLLTSFCIHLDLLQRLPKLSGLEVPLWFGQNTTGFPKKLPDCSAGPGQANPCGLQDRVARQIIEQGSGTWRASQMLWWRQTHFHNAGFDARVEAGSRAHGALANERTRALDRGHRLPAAACAIF